MNLENKRILFLDDNPEMRNSMRMQLSECGLRYCVPVRNVKEAITRLADEKFDVVISDYNLGQGTDGQQLLELMRRKQVLPLSTAFLMVTGESNYQQVSTAAEYSPDDYLLKPFTSDVLAVRLMRVLEKKEALKSIHQHMVPKGNRLKALEACNAALQSGTRYLSEVQRLKGELLLETNQYDEAFALYEEILAQRMTPWAVVGRALALKALNRDEEAIAALKDSLEAYPNFLVAYDELAELLAKTDKVAAQGVVESALKVSASTQRQRELGTLALENKDYARAETALRIAVEKDRTGFFKSQDDYALLAKSCTEQEKYQEALTAVKDMGMHLSNTLDLKARQAALECQVQMKAGNPEAAQQALTRASEIQQQGGLDAKTALEVAQSCFVMGKDDEARQILQTVAEDYQENPEVLSLARAVFKTAGLENEGVEFLDAAGKRMIALNNEAVALAKRGELDQAVDMLAQAASRLRNNTQVAINAAQAILMRISKQGMDTEQLAQARGYIEQAAAANPEHPKLAAAVAFYKKIAPEGAPFPMLR